MTDLQETTPVPRGFLRKVPKVAQTSQGLCPFPWLTLPPVSALCCWLPFPGFCPPVSVRPWLPSSPHRTCPPARKFPCCPGHCVDNEYNKHALLSLNRYEKSRQHNLFFQIRSPRCTFLHVLNFPRTIPRTHGKNSGKMRGKQGRWLFKKADILYRYRNRGEKRENMTYGLRSQRPCVRIAPGAPQISSPHEESLARAFFVSVVRLSGRSRAQPQAAPQTDEKRGIRSWRMPRSISGGQVVSPGVGPVVGRG